MVLLAPTTGKPLDTWPMEGQPDLPAHVGTVGHVCGEKNSPAAPHTC